MKRIALIVITLIVVSNVMCTKQKKYDSKLISRREMSLEELHREPINFELNIPYADTDNPRQRLDLYLPKNPNSNKLPVIVFFHGGGWMKGDKFEEAGRLMPFLRAGQYASVLADYRLSGEAQWPAQIYDSKAVIRWVRANASRYGLDADHIGVWGESAGAHLVLMLGVSGDVPELEGDIGPYKGVSSKVAAVVNFYGPSDFLAMIGPPGDIDSTKSGAPMAKLLGGSLHENPEKAKTASPITYVNTNEPPVLTVHGTKDQTVPYDQAVRLDATLREAGVASYFITVKDGRHGFGNIADDRVKAFFDHYLRRKDVEISTEPLNQP